MQIWHLISNEDSRIKPEIAADLSRHQKAVNTVRWSPSGEYLASGDDESVIFIWKLKSESETINILGVQFLDFIVSIFLPSLDHHCF